MEKATENELREGTQFWIESARITAGGVSGLGTLLSGVYIGIRPGAGKPTRHFVALETPPVYQVDVPGKRFVLRAEKLGSVSPGSPIYFRGIEVGGVLGYQLDENGKDVSIYAFVRAPFDAFVRRDSRFWNASGIDVSLTGAGVNVRTESLQAILMGGIAFDTPVDASASQIAEDNAAFPLFASYDAIQQAQYTVKMPFVLYFDGSVSGLEAGAAVLSQGIKLGAGHRRPPGDRPGQADGAHSGHDRARAAALGDQGRSPSDANPGSAAYDQVGRTRSTRPTAVRQSLDGSKRGRAAGLSRCAARLADV